MSILVKILLKRKKKKHFSTCSLHHQATRPITRPNIHFNECNLRWRTMAKGIVRVMSIFLLRVVGAIPRVSSKLERGEEDGHVPWRKSTRGEEERNCTCSCNCSGRAAHASFDKILYRPREALNRENCIQWPTSRKEVIGLAVLNGQYPPYQSWKLRDVAVARITTFALVVETKLDSWLSCRDNRCCKNSFLHFTLFRWRVCILKRESL